MACGKFKLNPSAVILVKNIKTNAHTQVDLTLIVLERLTTAYSLIFVSHAFKEADFLLKKTNTSAVSSLHDAQRLSLK
jgi:hypothetical protein